MAFDQSFSVKSLAELFVKSDFSGVEPEEVEGYKQKAILDALGILKNGFGKRKPIQKIHIKKKEAYRPASMGDEILLRKISRNIKHFNKNKVRGRDYIISNFANILRDGTSYLIFRLDIKGFYESFSKEFILGLISEKWEKFGLSPQTKDLLEKYLFEYYSIGGRGLPRGMQLSAMLSELGMVKFDESVKSMDGVYFYDRYVDDIVVVTKNSLDKGVFVNNIAKVLPEGLILNDKKQCVVEVNKGVVHVSYLGYKFIIGKPKSSGVFRKVVVEIADEKVKKYKRRIVRAILDYERSRDFILLVDRVRYLATNFSVFDGNKNNKKLAGIYYGYRNLSEENKSLRLMDKFFKDAVFAKIARLSRCSVRFNSKQKRILLGQSFVKGYEKKSFVYFSPRRIAKIKECWMNE